MIEKVVELIRRFQPMSARSWEWDVLMTGSGRPQPNMIMLLRTHQSSMLLCREPAEQQRLDDPTWTRLVMLALPSSRTMPMPHSGQATLHSRLPSGCRKRLRWTTSTKVWSFLNDALASRCKTSVRSVSLSF